MNCGCSAAPAAVSCAFLRPSSVRSAWTRTTTGCFSAGGGTVWSVGVYHHVFDPSFKDDVPYNVVLVALAEGPRLIGNLVGMANDDIAIGLPVEVHFDDVTEDVTLVNFRPRPAG